MCFTLSLVKEIGKLGAAFLARNNTFLIKNINQDRKKFIAQYLFIAKWYFDKIKSFWKLIIFFFISVKKNLFLKTKKTPVFIMFYQFSFQNYWIAAQVINHSIP